MTRDFALDVWKDLLIATSLTNNHICNETLLTVEKADISKSVFGAEDHSFSRELTPSLIPLICAFTSQPDGRGSNMAVSDSGGS